LNILATIIQELKLEIEMAQEERDQHRKDIKDAVDGLMKYIQMLEELY